MRPVAWLVLPLLVVPVGCTPQQPEQSSTPLRPAPTGVRDPRLDAALSEPVEDPVYPDVGDPGVDALHYRLRLDWDRVTKRLDGTATVLMRATGDAPRIQLDLAAPLTPSAVRVDGRPVGYRHRGKDLLIEQPVRADRRYRLRIDYTGRPRPTRSPSTREDVESVGFTLSDRDEVWTIQEPYGAFTWYPVNDHPSDKALYDITISVQAPWVGVAGGRLTSRREVEGRTVTSYRLDEPASSYLTTLAIGDYRHETDRTASGVPLNYWVPRRLASAWPRVRRTRNAVEWVEQRLGPWPYSSAGTLIVDTMSGMETQTLITLGNNDYALSDPVLVHEMVHHYFGNQVTPRDWRDLWLSEGITTYLQFVYEAEATGESLDGLMDVQAERDQMLRDEAGPPARFDPDDFASGNVYIPPALMWHEVRRRVGDAAFWRAIRSWPRAHDNGNAGRRQLIAHMERSTGQELSGLFRDWLLSDTTPPRS